MFGEVFICSARTFRSWAGRRHLSHHLRHLLRSPRYHPHGQQIGLAKPSIARLDRLVTAELTVLDRRLGQLSARDEAAVRGMWNQHMRL
jgi:hypothetical protein